MDDEQLNQRISYLIEHGGIWDDPLQAMRRKLHLLMWMVSTALALNAVTLAAHLLH